MIEGLSGFACLLGYVTVRSYLTSLIVMVPLCSLSSPLSSLSTLRIMKSVEVNDSAGRLRLR